MSVANTAASMPILNYYVTFAWSSKFRDRFTPHCLMEAFFFVVGQSF